MKGAMTSTTNYSRGAAFERELMGQLQLAGYWCIRSAGSHGLVDVVALRQHFAPNGSQPAVLVQCKSTRRLGAHRLDSVADTSALVHLATTLGAIPVLAEKRPLGIRMTDLRTGHEFTP